MRELLQWYRKNKRDLPWRRTKDPYAIWISEIMLQQTQVDTVIPYYEKFLKKFPTVEKLARSQEETVLSSWSGLGYYSRARNLHKAAKIILEEHNGQIPRKRDAILKLPGIGRYTAGAILSIAYNKKEPILDGNVIRVLTRLHAIQKDPEESEVKKELWERAGVFADTESPGEMNQALMELGATVCLSDNPLCLLCPVQKKCMALEKGIASQLPAFEKKEASRKVLSVAVLIQKKNKFLIAKRPPARHLGEMWEFPQWEGESLPDPKNLQKHFRQKIGLTLRWEKSLAPVRHSIMNRRITLTPILCSIEEGKSKKTHYTDFRWKTLRELKNLPTSSINYKITDRLLAESGPQIFRKV